MAGGTWGAMDHRKVGGHEPDHTPSPAPQTPFHNARREYISSPNMRPHNRTEAEDAEGRPEDAEAGARRLPAHASIEA